jgi:tRNA uridine 5-carbamoylmethylation protein Kti12
MSFPTSEATINTPLISIETIKPKTSFSELLVPNKETQENIFRSTEIQIPSASQIAQESITKARSQLPAELSQLQIPKEVQQIVDDYKRLTNHQIGNNTTLNVSPENGGQVKIYYGQ